MQHLVSSGCYNILLQNRCIQIFFYPIHCSRMEQWNNWICKILFFFSKFLTLIISLLRNFSPLRLGLNHLNEHKFKHNFQDCVNLLCLCSLGLECLSHFFLHCHNFKNISPIHLMCVIASAHASTHVTGLMRVKIACSTSNCNRFCSVMKMFQILTKFRLFHSNLYLFQSSNYTSNVNYFCYKLFTIKLTYFHIIK